MMQPTRKFFFSLKVLGVKLSSRDMAQVMTPMTIFRLLKLTFSMYPLPVEFINYMS